MKTINLSDLENSDIKYKVSQFPDCQQDIVIDPSNFGYFITIKSKFHSFRHLELIICATKALRRLGVKELHLYIPYLLGARSDRQFQDGGTSYLVDIIAPIINAQNYESVTVLDVHSDVAPACINNLILSTNETLVDFAIHDLYDSFSTEKCILVSPDAGASKKIEKLAKRISYIGDIITCSKSRDTEGNLTKTVVPLQVEYENKDFVIIDDICDGGRTFINIAKVIREANIFSNSKIYLIVTHGIFSAGFEELKKYFDGIYCTNSIKDITGKYLHLNGRLEDTKIKQLQVI